MHDRRVIIGKISGIYGVLGWIKVLSYTRPGENILDYSPWFLKCGESWREFELNSGKVHGKGILANLAEVADRDTAHGLIDADIAVDHRQLPRLEDDNYYWRDLIGIEVVNLQHHILGKVADMTETGANDVVVVEGDKKWLIPYVRDVYIIKVDLQQGRIVVDWEI